MQYSLKDLFWSVTLIAFGTACWPLAHFIVGVFAEPIWSELFVMPLIAGGLLIGAGIGALFHRRIEGALVGAVMVTIVLIIAAPTIGAR